MDLCLTPSLTLPASSLDRFRGLPGDSGGPPGRNEKRPVPAAMDTDLTAASAPGTGPGLLPFTILNVNSNSKVLTPIPEPLLPPPSPRPLWSPSPSPSPSPCARTPSLTDSTTSSTKLWLSRTPAYRKEAARQAVWQRMKDNNSLQVSVSRTEAADAEGARICRRVPYFRGSHAAALRLADLEVFRSATTVAVGPSLSEKPIRFNTLDRGKILVVPELKLNETSFLHIVHAVNWSRTRCTRASEKGGAAKMGVPVGLEMLDYPACPPVDVYVVGSVAVADNGVRVGRGCGFGELEWAIMAELGIVTENTVVVTVVHNDQVVASSRDLPGEVAGPCDLPADLIVTPNKIIQTRKAVPRPAGIFFDLIDCEMLRGVPILAALKQRADAYANSGFPLSSTSSEQFAFNF